MKSYLFLLLLPILCACQSKFTPILNNELGVRANTAEYAHGCFAAAMTMVPNIKSDPNAFLGVAASCTSAASEFVLSPVFNKGKFTADEFFVAGCIRVSLSVFGSPKNSDAKQTLLSACEELLKARVIERQAM